MLHHPWTYEAMIHDMMDYRLNRLNLPKDFDPSSSQDPKKKSPSFFDLDEDLDQFWSIHRFSQFPQVAGMFLFLLTISFYSPPPSLSLFPSFPPSLFPSFTHFPFPLSFPPPPSPLSLLPLPSFPLSFLPSFPLSLFHSLPFSSFLPSSSFPYLNLTCYLVLFSPSQPLPLP